MSWGVTVSGRVIEDEVDSLVAFRHVGLAGAAVLGKKPGCVEPVAYLEAVARVPVSGTGQALHDFNEEVDDGVAVVGLCLDSVC